MSTPESELSHPEFPDSQPAHTDNSQGPITDAGAAAKPKSKKFTMMVGAIGAVLAVGVLLTFGYTYYMKKPAVVRTPATAQQGKPAPAAPAAVNPGATNPALVNPLNSAPSVAAAPAGNPAANPLNTPAPSAAPVVTPPAASTPVTVPPVAAMPSTTPPVASTPPPANAPITTDGAALANLAATPAGNPAANPLNSPAPADPFKALPSASPVPVSPPSTMTLPSAPPSSPAAHADPIGTLPAPGMEAPSMSGGGLVAEVRSAVRTEIAPLSARVAVLEDRMNRRDARGSTMSAPPKASVESQPVKPVAKAPSRNSARSAERSHRANRLEVLAATGSAASSNMPSPKSAQHCAVQSIIPGRAWIKASDGSFQSYGAGDTWTNGATISDIDPQYGIKDSSGRTLCAPAS